VTLFRYTAVGTADSALRRGELVGETAAEVRASLRRVGLQVLELRPARARVDLGSILRSDALHSWLRSRRRALRAELFDSLSTLLESGTPLLTAIDTAIGAQARSRSRLRLVLVEIRETLRAGSPLSRALAAHPDWFESAEVAMVEAGEHGGTLPAVLRSLAERHERSHELGQKLAAALAYPAVVAVVGLGALLFLSTKTLPELVRILRDGKVEPPALTLRVMGLGQFLLANGLWILAAAILAIVGFVALRRSGRFESVARSKLARRLQPSVVRSLTIAGFARRLAEMLRSGVPLVEALRVVAPTVGSRELRAQVEAAARRIERGDEISASLDDEHWFDPEFRRLVEIGAASGDLDRLLERLGARYERRSRRLIDRLSALLEPAVILVLASLIGVVVMAAVLPMVRLQEIL